VKAALIAPKGYEDSVLHSDIHLMLPLPGTLSNSAYLRTYKEAKRRGDYIILDNGVAEGQLVDVDTLLSTAELVGAQEVVAPDVMGNSIGTHKLTQDFLLRSTVELKRMHLKVMGVLQGRTWSDRMSLASYYASQPEITTIGIPKVVVQYRGSTIRAVTAQWLEETFPRRFEIHLLGASEHFVDELKEVHFIGDIRSTDSALPYKFTRARQRLGYDHEHVKRWSTYFTAPENLDQDLLGYNIQTYLRWAEEA